MLTSIKYKEKVPETKRASIIVILDGNRQFLVLVTKENGTPEIFKTFYYFRGNLTEVKKRLVKIEVNNEVYHFLKNNPI